MQVPRWHDRKLLVSIYLIDTLSCYAIAKLNELLLVDCDQINVRPVSTGRFDAPPLKAGHAPDTIEAHSNHSSRQTLDDIFLYPRTPLISIIHSQLLFAAANQPMRIKQPASFLISSNLGVWFFFCCCSLEFIMVFLLLVFHSNFRDLENPFNLITFE